MVGQIDGCNELLSREYNWQRVQVMNETLFSSVSSNKKNMLILIINRKGSRIPHVSGGMCGGSLTTFSDLHVSI